MDVPSERLPPSLDRGDSGWSPDSTVGVALPPVGTSPVTRTPDTVYVLRPGTSPHEALRRTRLPEAPQKTLLIFIALDYFLFPDPC